MNTVIVSECCNAETTEREINTNSGAVGAMDYCKECGKQCSTHEVCQFCLGTGKIEGTDSDNRPSGYFRDCQECADDTSDPDK